MESLTELFMQTVRKHRRMMHAILIDKGLHPGQPSLLHALSERDGQSQKELSKRLRHKAATTTMMLQRMEKAGMVRRAPDRNDQRVTRVFITDTGRKALQDTKEALRFMEAISFASFSEKEKEQLRLLLLKMGRNLEQNEPPNREEGKE